MGLSKGNTLAQKVQISNTFQIDLDSNELLFIHSSIFDSKLVVRTALPRNVTAAVERLRKKKATTQMMRPPITRLIVLLG